VGLEIASMASRRTQGQWGWLELSFFPCPAVMPFEMVLFTKAADPCSGEHAFLSTIFSDGCLGLNNDEGRSEV
jgi:hypothetical protein